MSEGPRIVGGFALSEELGRGGMGRVLAAVHLATGRRAAVKLVSIGHGDGASLRAAFAREVQAAARLHHPHVIAVYDHGTLEDGAPWVAMQRARGGTLRGQPIDDFAALREALLVVLDALAHAHARGVVHRDLKPENVLVDEGRLLLADFGIAWARSDASRAPGERTTYEDEPSIAGTPSYMAPEQVRGDLRAQGPWTDLYALGCMGWELASGAPPFAGPSALSVIAAQLSRPLPPLASRFPLPPGFDAWLGMLLAKEPRDRFRRAADAAAALAAFAAPVTTRTRPASDARPSPAAPTPIADLPTLSALEPMPLPPPREEPGPRATRSHAPPCPAIERWIGHATGVEPLPPGLGLGLFGLRDLPLVGRDEERAHLASLVLDLHRARRPRLALLRGEPGVGKTRLARWLLERAHELGAATPLVLRHGPIDARGQGVAGAIAGMLAASGLEGAELERRVASAVDEPVESPLVHGLAELVDPAQGAAAPHLRFDSSTERHEVVRQFLARLCEERPVLLLVDDAQWGLDALGLVRHLLRAAPIPVLVVLTVEPDALEGHEVERAMITGLSAAVDLTLAPLGEAAQEALARQLVGLSPEAATRLATSTRRDGPIFAVQLLAELVREGALVEGTAGLDLAPRGPVPANLDALWQRRLDAVTGSAPNRERAARVLDVVAAHGGALEAAALARVADAWGLAVGEDDVGHLVDRGLLSREGEVLRAAHPTLARAIEHGARQRGSWFEAHAAAARSLEDVDDVRSRERRARHLAEAGASRAALDALLAVADSHARSGDPDRAEAALGLARRLAAIVDLDASTSLELERLGTHLLVLRGEAARAALALPALVERARATGDLVREASLTRFLAFALRAQGRVSEATAVLDAFRGRREVRALPPWPLGELEFTSADLLFDQGLFAESLVAHRAALARFEEAGRLPATGHSWNGIANALAALGDLEGERLARERAVAIHLRCGSRYGRACALADAATTCARRGERDEARVLFDRAATLFEEIGSSDAEAVRRERDALS
jgi:serine/threonine protein kinase/tetratricopeptide (TPR) repeat protein